MSVPLEPLSEEGIEQLIEGGETETVEFKARANPSTIATAAAAFANTHGGTILVGVDDLGNVGLREAPFVAHKMAEAGIASVSPNPEHRIDIQRVRGKEIVVVRVEKGNDLYGVRGEYYERRGAGYEPLSGATIYQKAKSLTEDPETKVELRRLAGVIERLNADLVAERNWKKKAVEYLLGGAVGAVIGLGLAALTGVGL